MDLVVLATGMVPNGGEQILNLTYRQGPELPVLQDGFPDSHFVCFPYETRRTGIYAAGAVRAPMDAAQARQDAMGAALKAIQCVELAARGRAVHPRGGDLSYPVVLPAALHAMQALHRRVPVRRAGRGRQGHAQAESRTAAGAAASAWAPARNASSLSTTTRWT